MKRILLYAFLLLLAYLLFYPVSIDPVVWTPPESIGFEGKFAKNDKLSSTETWFKDVCHECESVYVDTLGNIYASAVDGNIWLFKNKEDKGQILANTEGRPLGLNMDTLGNLIVADSKKGLLSITPNGEITTLSTTADDLKYGIADDLDIAKDGTVYFSDASWKFAFEGYKLDLLEHGLNGRLIAYNPATKTAKTLLDNLQFANGIAVSPEQDFVLVAETGKYRVTRYWLNGEKRGTSDIFIDNLPGFPDGITLGENGTYWLSIISPRDGTLDATLPYPFARKIIARLPEFLKPKPQNYACVLGLNRNGDIIQNLQDPAGGFAQITCTWERNGKLHFGSLGMNGIGVYDLKK